jgi:hypothetical protein
VGGNQDRRPARGNLVKQIGNAHRGVDIESKGWLVKDEQPRIRRSSEHQCKSTPLAI